MIYLLLELQKSHCFFGKNNFIGIRYILGYTQVLKLIMKLIFLVQEIKTTNCYKQNPVLNGFCVESDLTDNLKSGYYKSLLGYDNVDWFVNEIIKLENKMAFCIKNIKRVIITTNEDEQDYRKIIICRFCEKSIEYDKVRDRCHLTG